MKRNFFLLQFFVDEGVSLLCISFVVSVTEDGIYFHLLSELWNFYFWFSIEDHERRASLLKVVFQLFEGLSDVGNSTVISVLQIVKDVGIENKNNRSQTGF